MSDQLTETLDRLVKIDAVISKLCPEIRAAAFAQIAPLVLCRRLEAGPAAKSEVTDLNPPAAVTPVDTSSLESFFASLSHEKPNENVLAICAWLYSQEGVFSKTPEDFEAIASRIGLTIPRRVDMTLNVAKRAGKALFAKSGKAYSPTVHGELFLKQTYGVKKGASKA